MAQRFVVHTDCPTCGAPLDFSEGSNAIRCDHCRSNLLVTGRRQVLSYSIAPKVSPRDAVQVARFAAPSGGPPRRALDPEMWFVPYYRLTGHDFRWVRETVVQKEQRIPMAYGANGEIATSSFSTPTFPSNRTKEELGFQDRHVEKNFIACTLSGLGAYSLGVRASVLKLELFRRSDLEAQGKIAEPHFDAAAAMQHGLKSAELHRALHREVLARVLSLIYFPFWVVPWERGEDRTITVVDGVSQSVVGQDLPASRLDALHEVAGPAPATIGFRPLTCPNCGWDLPLRPDDVVFVCSSCRRAWGVRGDRLVPQRFAVATVAMENPSLHHLPHWAFRARLPGESKPRRFLIPAFRYRRLKHLADLATHLARVEPVVTLAHRDAEVPSLTGCFFDADDAKALCRFVSAGLDSQELADVEKFRAEDVRMAEPVLVWVPFEEGPHALSDPFTKTALPKNLLLGT